MLKSITTSYQPNRPPMVEYLVDDTLRQPIIEMLGREWVANSADPAAHRAYLDNFIIFWHRMGYDFVRMEKSLNLPRPQREGGKDARVFAESGKGPIATWQEFEQYPWPTVKDSDFADHHYIGSHLPEGMGFISCHAGGMYEHLSMLMGYETLCVALFDEPDLVQAVVSRLGELMTEYYRRLLAVPGLIAVWPGDDMGFRSGTMISPADLRKYTLTWHKQFARMTHEAAKPYFLHSCGNLRQIMEDLITDVGIDAKHSFEDAIWTAGEFKRTYGQRIGVLGGVDVDVLARRDSQEVRRYVRHVIDECAPGGRFAIGSGNSIPSYVPLENYLTMLDEALR